MRSMVKAKRTRSVRSRLSVASAPVVQALEGRALFSSVITSWSFSAPASPVVVNPAPAIGSGTAKPLGMVNQYSYAGTVATNSVDNEDVVGSGTLYVANAWRIRGKYQFTGTYPNDGTATSPGNVNGWNLNAPQYTQGAEFDVNTVGYQNITVGFDWFATSNGIRTLQEQYSTDGSTWTNIGGVLQATANDFYGGASHGATIDLSAIPGAANNPAFGIRLVSAYDPDYTGAGAPTYTSATLSAGTPVVYGNNSGNWRFTNVTISGDTIPFAPSISLQPSATQVSPGGTASFVAAANGFPTPTVQWQVSSNNGSTFSDIGGATATTYTFTAAASDNSKQYRAVFTNTQGSATTNGATLTVPQTPVVTVNPGSQAVNVGGGVTFVAAATSTPAPTVKWQVSTNGGSTFSDIGGATFTSYTVATVAGTDTGKQYRAVFNNSFGSTNTTAATLTVIGTPVTLWSYNANILPAYNNPIPVVGSGAAQTLGMQNDYSGFFSLPEADVTLSPSAANPTFSAYTWRVRGGLSPSSAGTPNGWSIYAPEKTQGAQFDIDTTGYANLTFSFDWYSTATGVRDMQEQYTINGGSSWIDFNPKLQAVSNDFYGVTDAVTNPTGVLMNLQGVAGVANNPNFGIRLVSAYDDALPLITDYLGTHGQYASAQVVNGTVSPYTDGSGNWRFANISLNGLKTSGAPGVVTQPTDVSVISGTSVSFTATAYAVVAPTVQWQRSTDGGFTFANVAGATATTYTFTAVTANNGYQYRAVFTNASGTATSNPATLSVGTPAAPVVTKNPSNVSVVAGDTTIFTSAASGNPVPTVQWQVSSNGGVSFTNVAGATKTTLSVVTAANASQNGYQYRAVFTNIVNGSSTATTTAATMKVLQAGVPITAWDFGTAVAAPVNNPAATYGTGTSSMLGMNNNYFAVPAVEAGDILATAGTASPTFSQNTWRVRSGPTATTGGGTANGWSNLAPQYTQGAEFRISTAGYQNVYATVYWYSTNQGIRDLQEQYTTDGVNFTNLGGPIQAAPNDYYGGQAGVLAAVKVVVDTSTIPGANNNPNFGIRLVSAYSSLLPDVTDANGTHGQYASATLNTDGTANVYNGTSGNWRFANIDFAGTAIPAWLAPNSVASWNNTTKTLTVSGATTIIADPGSDNPNIVATGAAAQVLINPASTLTPVHVGTVTLKSGAGVVIDASTTFSSLSLLASNATVAAGHSVVLDFGSLTVDGTSTLDIGDGNGIVRNATSNFSALQDLLVRGINTAGSSLWTGTGITSSLAAADTNLVHAVGLVSNTLDGSSLYDTFHGVSVGATDVLLGYVIFGDTDLSGTVDDTDYFLTNDGYGLGKTGWVHGDFNYDGVIDDTDFFLLNNGYSNQ